MRTSSIPAVLVLLIDCRLASCANPTTTPSDWQSRFQVEAPSEWKKLEDFVGRSCGDFEKTHADYFVGTTQPAERILHDKDEYWFNGSVGCAKIIRTWIPNPTDSQIIWCTNKKMFFAAEKIGVHQQLHVVKDKAPLHSLQQLGDANSLFAAEEVNDTLLSELFDGRHGTLRSVKSFEADGKRLVRVDFDRKFDNADVYPCSFVVDPNFHWAVVDCQQSYPSGLISSKVQYQDIAGVAFPKNLLQETIDSAGNKTSSLTIDFSAPQPWCAGDRFFDAIFQTVDGPGTEVISNAIILYCWVI